MLLLLTANYHNLYCCVWLFSIISPSNASDTLLVKLVNKYVLERQVLTELGLISDSWLFLVMTPAVSHVDVVEIISAWKLA